LARAAVGDGRLVGVQFDDCVIDAATGHRRHDMLDCEDFGVALGNGGGAISGGNVLHAGFDFRLAFEVAAAEADAVIGRGGQEGHIDRVAAVQPDA
jgi:hypothetical protein